MNKTFLKNILRDIKNTKGKVISIAVMVALAASVVVGLMLSGISMRNTLSKSLKTYDHPDIIVRSTHNLDYEDELILKNDPDISAFTLVKTIDLMEDESLIRIKSINNDIKKFNITKGSIPSKKDEIIIDEILSDRYQIGDKLEFSYLENSRIDDKALDNLSYTIVGFFKTSDYFMEDMRKLSYAAKKELDGYAYVLEENFDTDKYGEANIIYKSTNDMDFESDKYKDFVYGKKEKIEDSLSNRPGQVKEKIKSEVNDELDKARRDIDQAKEELTSAEEELEQARLDINQGYLDYEKSKETFYEEIRLAKDELKEVRRELIDGQQKIDQGMKSYKEEQEAFLIQIKDARNQINSKKEELNQGQKQIDQKLDQINNGYQKLDNEFKQAREDLDEAKIELDLAKEEIYRKNAEIQSVKNEIDQTKVQLENKEEELDRLERDNQSLTSSQLEIDNDQYADDLDPENIEKGNTEGMGEKLIESRRQLDLAYEDVRSKENQLDLAINELDSYRKEYKAGLDKYLENLDDLENRYYYEKKPLDDAKEQIDIKQKDIEEGYASIKDEENELDVKKNQGQAELDRALYELNQKQNQVDASWIEYDRGIRKLEDEEKNGKNKLKEAYQDLLDAEDEYNKGLLDFNKEKSDALEKISEGENEIEDGEASLLRLVDPEYDIETVFDNQGINTYYQNSLNMDELTKVFPSFFYLVAMLVTLTTMKRYIEEQRIINGTLKSLGYSNKDISGRFYIYGIIPTFIGSIIGALFGRYLIAKIIITAYSSGFGNIGIDFVNSVPYILFAIILSVLLIALTVYLSSKETVSQSPAGLLRTKAPNIGKKVWLEKIRPIWKNMSFMQKITARNIFRYKSRMFMTLFGVGGCTALTFFGFAMIDSIKDTIITEQYELSQYDLIAITDDNANEDELKNYNDAIKDYQTMEITFKEANVTKGNNNYELRLVIPSDSNNIDEFINLRTLDRKPINLYDEDAVISQKIFDQLDLSIGDEIKFSFNDETYQIPITNVIENYTGNYIYISKDSFERITKTKANLNANYLKGNADDMIKKIEDQPAVLAIINASVIYASIDVLLSNLNLVIGVITLISVLLALVVLYNLININVSERKRELATIKVLGFYPREVTNYIFREIFVLTILGIILGYGLGYAMFRYIIYVVAPEDVMLSYRVNPRPFIYSGLITIAISIVLLLIVHRKLKEIDMAEAMGSGVE